MTPAAGRVGNDSVYQGFDRTTRIKRVVKRALDDLTKPYDWAEGLYDLFVAVGKEGLEPSGYDILYAMRQTDRGEEAAIIEMLTNLYLETMEGTGAKLPVAGKDDEEVNEDEDIEFQ